MSVNVYVERPRLSVMKNGAKALAFNATFWEDDGWTPLVITGFRLMDGIINPPMVKAGYVWYPNVYLPQPWAELLYETVAGMDWVKIYDLPPLQKADFTTAKLTITPQLAVTVAPSLV